MRRLTFAPFILALLVLGCIHWCDELRAEDPPAIAWQSDYVAAYQKAEAARRMLVIYFSETAPADESQACVATLFAAAEFRRGFAGMTCLRLPLDAKVADEEGRPIRLIDHFSMTELHKQPGFALIDFREPESKHFARVVSLLPIGGKRRPTIAGVAALADLPAGSLTQRTLIWAVRIHGESPASTSGRFEPILAAAAESHSQHQANIRRQGHHGWEGRFHRLNAQLGDGLIAQEVCAESWPGESLVDAARECVRSWRQSSGHWQAVRTAATAYAYDLKRGSNGIWYATGIFGR